MIIEFDYDLAKDAVECEVGKLITRGGEPVLVTTWDYKGKIPEYVIEGFVGDWVLHWTKEGRRSLVTSNDTCNDLFLDIDSELFNTVESDAD